MILIEFTELALISEGCGRSHKIQSSDSTGMSLTFRRLSSISGLSLNSEDCLSLFQKFFIDFTHEWHSLQKAVIDFARLSHRFDRIVIDFRRWSLMSED